MPTKLIGTEPYQVPRNSDLGTLAYQDADAVNVGSLTITGLGTTAAIKTIATNSTAFVAERYSTVSGPNIYLGRSKSPYLNTHTAVASGDALGTFIFQGSDGTAFRESSYIISRVDGAVAANSVPSKLDFYTTPVGGTSPTLKLVIDSVGRVGIGTGTSSGVNLLVNKNLTADGGTAAWGVISGGQIQSSVTTQANYFLSSLSTAAASFTLADAYHYRAYQGVVGAGSTVTDQFAFHADATLTGATNNYGLYVGNISVSTGKTSIGVYSGVNTGSGTNWNLYIAGTALNYFAGGLTIGTTTDRSRALTVSGTVGFNIPADCWTNIGVSLDSTGGAGLLYSNGSYRASWVSNGYRNSSNLWTSLAVNSATGATMIEQDPTGYITFNTDASKATGSSSTVTERLRITAAGGISFGSSGTAYGTSGQALLSAGNASPVWTTLTLSNLSSAWVKEIVVAATTANITLSGTQTIDGIALVAGNRVLVKNQTTASQNGIYVVAAGAWTRAANSDTAAEIAGAEVAVKSGTVNGGLTFTTNFKSTDTLGTTAMNWYQAVDTSGTTFINNVYFSDSGTTTRGIRGSVGGSDQWFIGGGATANNAGFMEISTGDDGTEPIYVRQYNNGMPGIPPAGTIVRTAALLDASGNTSFPGSVTGNGFVSTTNNGLRLKPTTGTTNYGLIQRIDTTDFYLMTTNNNDADGNWNALRPFSVSLSDGFVTLGNGVRSTNKLYFGSSANQDYIGTVTGIQSWVYEKDFSVSAKDTEPRDIWFNPTGTIMYVLGNSSDSVHRYNLSTAWDLATAVFASSFSVTTQDTSPVGLFFTSDGLIMYIVGSSSDSVHRYNLSTAWDITTAVFANSKSVTAEETDPQAVFFNPTGTKMYITGTTGDDVNEYNLSTAWDITTAVYSKVFSVATRETSPQGLGFSDDGTKMYIVGTTYVRIDEYILSTAWDVGTAVFNDYVNAYNLGTYQLGGISGIFLAESGNRMFVSDYNNDRIFSMRTDIEATKLHGTKWIVEPDLQLRNDLFVGNNVKVIGAIQSLGSSYLGTLTSGSVSSVTFNTASSTGTFSLNTSGTTGACNFYTAQTSGILSIGGTAGTGNIVIGRSTSTSGQNIYIGSTGNRVVYGINAAVAAAGTTQATATAVNATITNVTTGTGGVVLPTAVAGMRLLVRNGTASAINIYPASAGIINALAANAAYSLAAGAVIEMFATTATQWYTF